ncbi:hypothetical protein Lal_00042371 [Lupinus albus]|nr:hypothetical protein Lal_00042371 [Lupinus albus]
MLKTQPERERLSRNASLATNAGSRDICDTNASSISRRLKMTTTLQGTSNLRKPTLYGMFPKRNQHQVPRRKKQRCNVLESENYVLKDKLQSSRIVCLRTHRQHWYLDSRCSRHKTGYVTYGDNNQGNILRIRKIVNASQAIINNVLYVEGLEHNLLSISQLCDRGNKVSFDSNCCNIRDGKDNKVKFISHRINNIYMKISLLYFQNVSFQKKHRRVAHINLKHLEKVSPKELVVGLPKLNFKTKDICDTCQKCKQTKKKISSKNVISTTRSLVLLHMDLFGV